MLLAMLHQHLLKVMCILQHQRKTNTRPRGGSKNRLQKPIYKEITANLECAETTLFEFQVFIRKMSLHIRVTHGFCVSGSEAAEERRRAGLQHLHGDPGRERGAGRLGPPDLSLPFPSASGEPDGPKRGRVPSDHDVLLFPQEPHIGSEGMLGAGLLPEQLRLLQRFRPELGWDQTGTAVPLSCRADRDTIGFFIAKFLKI